MAFKFNMGESVEVVDSREIGTVVGRCEYGNGDENQYYVRVVRNEALERTWLFESELLIRD